MRGTVLYQVSSLVSNWPGEHTTVTVGRPDNKQNRCRTGEECVSSRFAISCYRDDVKKE